MKHLPYHTRLAQLGLWTLEERRHRADLLEVFRMYKGLSLTPFCRFFTLSPVNNTRGHSAKVLKNRCSLDLRRFFLTDGTLYHSMWLTLEVSTRLRMVSNTMRRYSMGFFMDWLGPSGPRPHMFLRILWNRCGRTWYTLPGTSWIQAWRNSHSVSPAIWMPKMATCWQAQCLSLRRDNILYKIRLFNTFICWALCVWCTERDEVGRVHVVQHVGRTRSTVKPWRLWTF